jgi:hypothetical protein
MSTSSGSAAWVVAVTGVVVDVAAGCSGGSIIIKIGVSASFDHVVKLVAVPQLLV